MDKEQIKAKQEHLALRSNSRKWDREFLIVRAFLRHCEITFKEVEIIQSIKQDDIIDVEFRSSRFQVCEELSGRKPGEEIKAHIKILQGSTGDLLWTKSPQPQDPLKPEEVLLALGVALANKEKKYGAGNIGGIDVLVYLDIGRRLLQQSTIFKTIPNSFSQWRSVSFIHQTGAMVVCAGQDAPVYMKLIEGQFKFSNMLENVFL